MLFNSIHFVIFFPLVILFYFALPYKYRWILLLGASYYFYMCWKVEYLLLIIISTIVDYYAGIQMGKYSSKSKRKPFLIFSFLINIGLLFLFKYYVFFSNSLNILFDNFNIFYEVPMFDLLLPVGISFYTFQTLSYTIDVYRGDKKPEKHLGIFALYVSFFPQLVAGPIERSVRLLPQLYKKFDFNYQRVTEGLKLMVWGFFKKLVIADTVAIIVNQVYNDPENYSGFALIFATYMFAFQIYCDFSGYSDIAIGAAKIMGYNLMVNFKQPYFSQSIFEFWKRWHISLSTWFRDYLYIPIGGNRVAKYRWYINIMIVFLISGFWHGANWTFLVWGGLHGLYFILTYLINIIKEKSKLSFVSGFNNTRKIFNIIITFNLVSFSWIFFRANSISDALFIIRNLFSDFELKFGGYNLGLGQSKTITIFIIIILLIIVDLVQYKYDWQEWLMSKPVWVRWTIYYSFMLLILIFGVFSQNEFIYFQF